MAISSTIFPTLVAPKTAFFFSRQPHPVTAAPPSKVRFERFAIQATASKPASPLRGIMKPRRVSPEMEALVGAPEISRTQALKQIWAYIKENNCQDPEDKKIIICDEKLRKIFAGKDRIGFLEIAGLITPHFLKDGA